MTDIASELMTNWPAWVWGHLLTLTLGVLLMLLFYRGWMIEAMKKTCAELRAEIAAMRAEIEQFKVDQEAWHRHIEDQQKSPWDIHRKSKSA